MVWSFVYIAVRSLFTLVLLSTSTNEQRDRVCAPYGLGEPSHEAKCRVGDLAPTGIDREGMSASLDLDDLGHSRVALLVFV